MIARFYTLGHRPLTCAPQSCSMSAFVRRSADLILPDGTLHFQDYYYHVIVSKKWVQVVRAVRGILGLEIAMDAPLMTAGLDSLGAVELHRELSRCHCLSYWC